MEITREILESISPTANPMVLEEFAATMTEAFPAYDVDRPLRAAHFLAQAAHESGGFRVFVENLNYSADRLLVVFPKYFRGVNTNAYARNPQKIANRVYASRMGNGDEASGDGWRFRGRGIFQVTGRSNYETLGDALGIDIVNDPDLATMSDNAVYLALEYWQRRGLNADADRDDIVTVTKKINGGTHGLDERQSYLRRAKKALGI